jgi:fucose permease
LSFAVPISMLGIIWPEVRERFDQSLGALGLAGLLYGLGRLSTALTGPRLVRVFGPGRAFVLVLVLLSLSCVALAFAPTWPAFLAALVCIGWMSGSLDSLGAGFITSIRDVGSAGLVHGAYGVGATLGPLVVVAVSSWRLAVGVAAALAFGAAALAVRSRHAWPEIPTHVDSGGGRAPLGPIVLSLGAFCAFVAIEVTAGQWAFTHLTRARGAGDTLAAIAVSLYWGGITVGRLALARRSVRDLVERLRLARLAALALLSVLTLAVLPPVLTAPALAMTGLALAPIVPSLFASTATRVGEAFAQKLAVWQLVATNLGAISVPFLTGALVDVSGPSVIVTVAAVTAAVGALLLTAIDRLAVPTHRSTG